MKLNSIQLEMWLKKNNVESFKIFVVYGQDEGGIDIATQSIIKAISAGSEATINKFNFKDVKDDASMLAMELNSVSLFEDKNIVIVEECGQGFAKAVMEYLKEAKFSSYLILKGTDLKPASGIRKLGEDGANCVSVACYKDDPRQLEGFISTYLSAQGIKFEPDVPAMLANIMPSNKMIIQSELEKLITFNNKDGAITSEDVREVISDSKELALDDLCVAVALSNKARIVKSMDLAINNEISYVMILRVLQKYLNRILDVYSKVEGGLTVDMAIAKLSPPVFFKQKDNLIKVCKTLDKNKVLSMLSDVVYLELECKKRNIDQLVVISNYFTLRKAG